jgi:transcriptional regulator with XRE-family HTH domain
MLDIKKVGIKIALLRKKSGYSQEKLAEMLCVSPQAISKWENGHTLPETSLLPVLAQIFECTIDDIIMLAYSFDEKIEEDKINPLKEQAEYIANQVIEKLENKSIRKEIIGLDESTIFNSVQKANGNIGNCTIKIGKPIKTDGNYITNITVFSPQKEFKLIEKVYTQNDTELHRYNLLSEFTTKTAKIYHIDFEKRAILMDDLSSGKYIQGCYDENNEYGDIYRENYFAVLKSVAELHTAFWENYQAFERIGLDWRLQSKENIRAHISAMERDYKNYRKHEEEGLIPMEWDCGEKIIQNKIDNKKLDYFNYAIEYMKKEYPKLIETRFNAGKNITIIHGDMHPGTTYLSKTSERTVKFSGLQAVRMGLCTEDLAMLLALHIEPDKQKVKPLLDNYYYSLIENIKDYSYEDFINDYKISIAENLFFTLRLIHRKIFDFNMRDKALKAFETFVLESE